MNRHRANRPLRLALLLLAAGALSGCTTLTAGGLLAAARLSPLTADPADVGIAVSVPAGVGLRTGDARLHFAFEPDSPGEAPFVESFALEIVDLETLAGAAPEDEVFAARLATADHGRFRAAQARVRRLRASGDDGRGSLSIAIDSACFTGERPGQLPVGTWIRTAADADFVRLTRRRDLLAMLGDEAEALRSSLARCGTPAIAH